MYNLFYLLVQKNKLMDSSYMKKIFYTLITVSLLSGCAGFSSFKAEVVDIEVFELKNPIVIGKTFSNQDLKLGGFEAIEYKEEREGAYYFNLITGRGPTSSLNDQETAFLLPNFQPSIYTIKADKNDQTLKIAAEIKLKKSDGSPLSGLPLNRTDENPVDVHGLYFSVDAQGVDPKGISTGPDGLWWVADQYMPSLVQFNQEGEMTKRLTPAQGLPRVYAEKIKNAGFLGIARFENKIFGFLPSFLENDKESAKPFSRIVEVDSNSMKTTNEYFYQLDNPSNIVSDASAVSAKSFVVLEKGFNANHEVETKIYLIKTKESDSAVTKHLLLNLNTTAFKNVKDVSGITYFDGNKIALIANNQYEISGKTKTSNGLTPMSENKSQLMIIEFNKTL